MGIEQTGLSKAPRGSESDRHAISGRALERIELEPPINERVRLNGPLVAERVHRTSLYGLAGQSWVRACGCLLRSLAEFDAVGQDWAARRQHVVVASISPDRLVGQLDIEGCGSQPSDEPPYSHGSRDPE